MSFPRFSHKIEILNDSHSRADFSCGIEALDRYLKEQANQDLRRYIATPFVLIDLDASRIAGYYTLAASSIELSDLPEDKRKKLPRYPLLPAILLGRLAVDKGYQGQRLGSFLLADALYRSLISDIAAVAIIVDAKDDVALSFYEYHQFLPLLKHQRRLYLPMTTIAKRFN